MSDKRTGKKKKKIRPPVITEAPILGQAPGGLPPKKSKTPTRK